jgi:hypothetical protein
LLRIVEEKMRLRSIRDFRWPLMSITLLLASPALGAGEPRVWNFDVGDAEAAPPGFSFGRTGGGAVGRWVLKKDASAPSGGQVLAQVDTDNTDFRFPVAVADEPSLTDLQLKVRCKPVSGKVDQACGLVFRYQDENNYYVTRANALEDNVRLYRVVNGKRIQFASWKGKVKTGVWHELAAQVKGDHFQVWFNGKQVMDARDGTFKGAGKVGVWTKADSVTHFDDLTVSAP